MMDQQTVRPGNADELREILAEAAGVGRRLEVRAGASKRDIGHPDREALVVDLSALSGVIDYEPSELVLTALPATPLAEIERMLAARGQMLAFEPWDHGTLLGGEPGGATLGGIVAAGVAGPRRVSAGGARDHLLGFAAISGRAEEFKGGGKVVKNVTGYDISKVMAGSWGQLAVMTELTVKVVPAPRAIATVALEGLEPEQAVAAMSRAMGSPCAPAAAAHRPPSDARPAMTAIRLEGFRESVDARAAQLIQTLAEFAPGEVLDKRIADEWWSAVREGAPIVARETAWRIHVAPSQAPALAAMLHAGGASWYCDWAGALVWAGASAAFDVRAAAAQHGAHAMLLRAPLELRRRVPARHLESEAVTALTARLKRAFDPAGILDPQRFA